MHGTLTAQQAYETPAAAPRRRRPWLWALVLLAVGAVAAFFLLRPDDAAAPAPATGAAADAASRPRVTVIVPGQSVVANEVRVTGSIAARRTSPVGIQGEGGLITAVLVKEGDFVSRGQPLVAMDSAVQQTQVSQMQANIRTAQADAALAEAELKRAQALVSRGFISKADIERRIATRDAARSRVDLARAQTAEMQARLARMVVRAPDSGLILTRAVEPGQVVSAGSQALFTMAQGGLMEMRAQVAEQDLASVRLGQSATVRVVGSADAFTGQVALIEPVVDPQARQGVVRILLGQDRRLRPGAFAQATVRAGEADRPVLPQSAIQADARGNFVLTVAADGKVARRDVTLGFVTANGIEIRSGLAGNERIVESAGAFLNPGETVTPVIKRVAAG